MIHTSRMHEKASPKSHKSKDTEDGAINQNQQCPVVNSLWLGYYMIQMNNVCSEMSSIFKCCFLHASNHSTSFPWSKFSGSFAVRHILPLDDGI